MDFDILYENKTLVQFTLLALSFYVSFKCNQLTNLMTVFCLSIIGINYKIIVDTLVYNYNYVIISLMIVLVSQYFVNYYDRTIVEVEEDTDKLKEEELKERVERVVKQRDIPGMMGVIANFANDSSMENLNQITQGFFSSFTKTHEKVIIREEGVQALGDDGDDGDDGSDSDGVIEMLKQIKESKD